ncbi:GTP cyclohydrolase N terminal-domain-containing protein [Radiomyces spectabilis]|uniref:GTP cyclohydrolase N terminal-domain-containing protein n=1 Tax=Radiomyces spectabilis TaxID=64574 RepID=UPI0022205859|nr:GTP cyclohydrolase N terminal-domain-containing protein [Radiomyces spectabilis]KAI8374149.1 GTP cyclohydrolase N terminal-domain-containing protein [Radiomyces spectabilis]
MTLEADITLQDLMASVEAVHKDQLIISEKVNKKLPEKSSSPESDSAYSSTSLSSNANTEEGLRRSSSGSQTLYPGRVILTTYPGQQGIRPVPLKWAASDPKARGPIVASRHPDSIKKRNAIGAYGGSYCIYRALALAIGDLPYNHRPNFEMTEPTFQVGPHASWFDPKKIVSLDPWGHLAPMLFKAEYEGGLDVRPTIAITRAHMTMAEMEMSVKQGSLAVDGKIVLNNRGDLAVSKAAVEPVWYLPGVAERFGIGEDLLRRALFEDTGGMYPELITRQDLKVFLPPIGGISVYIFGNPAYLSDPSKKLTVRVHDECNGSDVFGNDICTCRPYLIYGIEECVKQAQQGGVGLIVYFRKEGRALGEVTKYLVYNARKRQQGGDTAAKYFLRTECIAGVKDMRFQSLMPDVLHWLGIQKIDRMMSMSNMKYDAIVNSGIPILERVPIPEEMIPDDSRVEIDAKIASGYFTSGDVLSEEQLAKVKGRNWEDIEH